METEHTGVYTYKENGEIVLILTPYQSTPAVTPPVNLIPVLRDNPDPVYPFPTRQRAKSDIKYLTRHHGVSWNVAGWHRHHVDKGWTRIGYHFCIALHASQLDLYQTNHISTISWHDTRNYDTLSCSFGGWMEKDHDPGKPTDEQLNHWGRLTAWLDITNAEIWPNLRGIPGHQYWQATRCPGDEEIWIDGLIQASLTYGQDIEPLIIIGKPNALLKRYYEIRWRGPGIDEREHLT